MKARYFGSPADFRQWLMANHGRVVELWVGFYKKDSGRGGLTYAEALDEALCFGWIDGLRKKVDALSFKIRFTPRRANSVWSRVNLRHVGRLKKSGRMMPAGLKVHAERNPAKSGIYAFENRTGRLTHTDERKFKANKPAWNFFRSQAPWYQRNAIWWVVSAKKEVTRHRRLAKLIEDSAHGRWLAQLARRK
jgi:uncharacterized protein YdeI (YjbR/CyaY-like superfamily)